MYLLKDINIHKRLSQNQFITKLKVSLKNLCTYTLFE